MNKFQIHVKKNMKYLSICRPDLKRRVIKKDATEATKWWYKNEI